MLRTARDLVPAVSILVPVLAWIAIPRGRAIGADGFMQLRLVGLPAAALALALIAGRRWAPGWRRSRAVGGGLAVAGTLVGFEAMRLISGWWLLLGRALQLDTVFLTTTGAAAWALVGGLILLVQGSRQARGRGSARAPVIAGVAIVAVAALPVFVLTGDGVALIVFDDLAEPGFSAFPGDGATLQALLVGLAGLGLVLLGALGPWGPTARGRSVLGVTGLGVAVLLVGVWLLVDRGLVLREGFEQGALWPGVNIPAVVGGLAAGWIHLRRHRAAVDRSVVFGVEARDRR